MLVLSPSQPVAPWRRTCGVSDLDPATLADLSRRMTLDTARSNTTVPPPAFELRIPVVFHVIHAGADGKVAPAAVAAQITALNVAYSGKALRLDGNPGGGADTGVSFVLASLVYHDVAAGAVPAAFYGCSQANAPAIGAALSVAPATNLNIFTCSPVGGLLGWVNLFPPAAPEDSTLHAVFALHQTLPGGAAAPYNLGATIVHEVGHYLGLFHTFQNGCGPAGDVTQGDCVEDTPPEAAPAYGSAASNAGRDTCTGAGQSQVLLGPWLGKDAWSSFMDYSDDAAMTVFSPGQAARLQAIVTLYKPALCAAMPSGSCGAAMAAPTGAAPAIAPPPARAPPLPPKAPPPPRQPPKPPAPPRGTSPPAGPGGAFAAMLTA